MEKTFNPLSTTSIAHVQIISPIRKLLKVESVITGPILTDITFARKKENKNNESVRKRDYKNFKQQAFLCDLALKKWEMLVDCEDVNKAVELFTQFINDVLDKHAPMKEVRTGKRKKKSKLSLKILKEIFQYSIRIWKEDLAKTLDVGPNPATPRTKIDLKFLILS